MDWEKGYEGNLSTDVRTEGTGHPVGDAVEGGERCRFIAIF